MALAYLRAAPARRLIVELDWVRGRRPREEALTHLSTVLERETEKPGGIALVRSDEIPGGRTSYTIAQIAAIEQRYRDNYSTDQVAVMWILSLDGELDEQPSSLGIAFRASSIVIFADRVEDAETPLASASRIERAVLTHEAGHLLALVNIGYRSRHDREDSTHPNHSRMQGSVMYWAIEDLSVASILGSGPPIDFDRYDRDDLRMLREG